MLNCDRRADLIRKIPINGKELFYDMIHEIYSPVTDGWSTREIVLNEHAYLRAGRSENRSEKIIETKKTARGLFQICKIKMY